LPTIPVAISLLASFTSANTVLGYPGIVYQFGAIYWVFCLHNFLSIPVAAHVFIPIFHRLRLTSVYEYLELRFSGRVRLLASVIFCIQTQFYMAVVLYAPAIALRGVTGIKVWVSILSTGLVCTAYTVLGGLKAVVWTDVFQMVVVYVGIFTMLVTGIVQAGTVQEGEGLRWSHLVGGVQRIWGEAANRSRLNFLELSPSPTEEYTLWSTFVGGTFTALTVYVSNQSMVQRYLATRHVRQAQVDSTIRPARCYKITISIIDCKRLTSLYGLWVAASVQSVGLSGVATRRAQSKGLCLIILP
jgi:SSS family transporter